jgi:hypothetical protein
MARDGALNEGFFHVLEANIDEALEEEGKLGGEVEGGGQVTTRSQVLTHINTRCKEEVRRTRENTPSSVQTHIKHFTHSYNYINTPTSPSRPLRLPPKVGEGSITIIPILSVPPTCFT